MKKKAQSTLYFGLRAVVIVGILLLIYLFFLRDFFTISESANINERCKKSVQLYCASKVTDKSFFRDIDCETQYITIEGGDERNIKRELANAMYHCWDNMGRGECELFPAPREKQCIVCHVFDFEDKGKKVSGLVPYMVYTKIPGTDTYYYDFIYNRVLSEKDRAKASSSVDYIDMNYKYAVIFGIYKKDWWTKFQQTVIGGLGTGVATALVISYFIPGVNLVSVIGTALVGIAIGVGAAVSYATYEADYEANVMLYPYDHLYQFGCDEMRGKHVKE